MPCYMCCHCGKCGMLDNRQELRCATCGMPVNPGEKTCARCGKTLAHNIVLGYYERRKFDVNRAEAESDGA